MHKYLGIVIKLIIAGLIIYRLGVSKLTGVEYIIFFLLVFEYLNNKRKIEE